MIDKLRSIAIFATVVDAGTFRAAASQLGIAPSRVSEIVSALERGLDEISRASTDPHGVLRVTAPAFVTQTGLIDRFAAFARKFPRIDLKLDFSDTPKDLIKDGFDVGIRAGWLEDSALMTRKIGRAYRLLVASVGYQAARAAPTHPRDLEDWDWIRFAMRAYQTELTSPTGEIVVVTGRSNLSVNSADSLYEFASRGLGVTAIPENLASRGLERGELVHVLPDWTVRSVGFHAVWPDQSRRQSPTTLFVRFLADSQCPVEDS